MKTAIFDLDGTLANTLCDLGDAVNYGLEKLGCPVHDYESYKKMVGNGAKKPRSTEHLTRITSM